MTRREKAEQRFRAAASWSDSADESDVMISDVLIGTFACVQSVVSFWQNLCAKENSTIARNKP